VDAERQLRALDPLRHRDRVVDVAFVDVITIKRVLQSTQHHHVSSLIPIDAAVP